VGDDVALASAYDDAIWEQIGDGDAPAHLVDFVRSLSAVESALDVGCGDGRLTRELAVRDLTAADVSVVVLARARERLVVGRLVELDPGAPLPLEDGSFDLVLCSETLEHVQDVQQLLSEARRVLRPGGTLAITTPAHSRLTAARIAVTGFELTFDPLSPHLRFFTRRSLTRVLDGMGFDVVSARRRRGTLLVTARR